MSAEIINTKKGRKVVHQYGVMQHEWADAHPKTPKHLQLGPGKDLQKALPFGRSIPTNSSRFGASSTTSSLKSPKSSYRRTRLLDRRYTISTPTTFLSFTHSRAVQLDSIACRECCDMVTLDRSSILRTGSCGGRSGKSAAVHLQGLEEGEVEEGSRETWLGRRIEHVDVEFPDTTKRDGAEPAVDDGQVAGEALPVHVHDEAKAVDARRAARMSVTALIIHSHPRPSTGGNG
jgi:hypothetical protein